MQKSTLRRGFRRVRRRVVISRGVRMF